MFYDWVSTGAIFGIKAFFAVATFLLFCGAVLGFLALVGAWLKAGRDEDDLHRR